MSHNNPYLQLSGIRDNHHRGTVGDFLRAKIKSGSTLSIVSAYFTIYAFEALKEVLLDIENLHFLFGEPRFIKSIDLDKTDKKAFKIEDDGLLLQNRLELNPFIRDRFSYTVLSHTDLSRDGGLSGDINLATINWGNYDLVVIDESHNFRNNTKGKRDEEGKVIRKSRYERLMEDIIQSGIKTKVLLLSATPVNNNLTEILHIKPSPHH